MLTYNAQALQANGASSNSVAHPTYQAGHPGYATQVPGNIIQQ